MMSVLGPEQFEAHHGLNVFRAYGFPISPISTKIIRAASKDHAVPETDQSLPQDLHSHQGKNSTEDSSGGNSVLPPPDLLYAPSMDELNKTQAPVKRKRHKISMMETPYTSSIPSPFKPRKRYMLHDPKFCPPRPDPSTHEHSPLLKSAADWNQYSQRKLPQIPRPSSQVEWTHQATEFTRSFCASIPKPTSLTGRAQDSGKTVRMKRNHSSRRYPCPLSIYGCHSNFSTKHEWKAHLTAEHVRLDCWRCYLCNQHRDSSTHEYYKDFQREDFFIYHLRRVHMSFGRRSCFDSNKFAINDHNIANQLEKCRIPIRSPPPSLKCSFCDMTFLGKDGWDSWMDHVYEHMQKDVTLQRTSRWEIDPVFAEYLEKEGIVVPDTHSGNLVIGDGVPRDRGISLAAFGAQSGSCNSDFTTPCSPQRPYRLNAEDSCSKSEATETVDVCSQAKSMMQRPLSPEATTSHNFDKQSSNSITYSEGPTIHRVVSDAELLSLSRNTVGEVLASNFQNLVDDAMNEIFSTLDSTLDSTLNSPSDGNDQTSNQSSSPHNGTIELSTESNGTSIDSNGKARSRKRYQRDDEDEDAPNKRPNNGDNKGTSQKSSSRRFACPYFQHKPVLYADRGSCTGPGFESIHRMKEHLYRCHKQKEQCPRCHHSFSDFKQMIEHLSKNPRCEAIPAEVQQPDEEEMHGFDEDQAARLRVRFPTGLREHEKWESVFNILFPDVAKGDIPSPYFDPSARFNSPHSPGSDAVRQFNELCRRELPAIVQSRVERAIQEQLRLLSTRLTDSVPDIIREAREEFSTRFTSFTTASKDLSSQDSTLAQAEPAQAHSVMEFYEPIPEAPELQLPSVDEIYQAGSGSREKATQASSMNDSGYHSTGADNTGKEYAANEYNIWHDVPPLPQPIPSTIFGLPTYQQQGLYPQTGGDFTMPAQNYSSIEYQNLLTNEQGIDWSAFSYTWP